MRAALLADPIRLAALALATGFGLYGSWWGWVECWNPDQMAFDDLFSDDRGPFEPGDFLKPPFYTYANFFLSVAPAMGLDWIAERITGSGINLDIASLRWSRLLQIALFVGSVLISYRIVDRSSGRHAARIVALLLATSAGVVIQAHYLTTDMPVTFAMIGVLWCSQSIAIHGRTRDYLIAGLATGVATATKYNALAMGLTIPLAHLFRERHTSIVRHAVDPRLIAGVAMVVVGFVAATPYAAISSSNFVRDVAYQMSTYAVYEGVASASTGYRQFLFTVPDILGWPVAIAAGLAVLVGVTQIRRFSVIERATFVSTIAVILLYFLAFGGPDRVEARFVLPVAPLLLIAAGPAAARLAARAPGATTAAVVLAVVYGSLASGWVGWRFANDPRMAAQAWVAAHVPAGAVIETSPYAPKWNLYVDAEITDLRMPWISTRQRMFNELFANDPALLAQVREREPETGVDWYDAGALARRNPDYIALDSLYFERFLTEDSAAYYPEIRAYLTALFAGRLGYTVVLDRTARRSPAPLYPHAITFVDNRIVILKRVAR